MRRIRRYDSPIPANQAADFLRSRGIPAEVVGDTDAFGGMAKVFGMGVYDVVTLRQEDADEAARLLAEIPEDAFPAEVTTDAPAPDLSRLDPQLAPPCPACNNPLPLESDLDMCPACGEPVDVAALIVERHGPEALSDCYDDETAEALPPRAPGRPACPACGYSLDGLGARGHCPECGAQFPQPPGW
jgi:rubrerythrin